MSEQQKPRAVSPSEAIVKHIDDIPDEVFEVVNTLISRKSSTRGSVTVKQEDILTRLMQKGLDRDQVFDQGWLDFEDAYREQGWEVTYYKPGYNEPGVAYFQFSVA